MDSLWENFDPDERVDAQDILQFSDSPGGRPLDCHCLYAVPGGRTPKWPLDKCQTNDQWTSWLDTTAKAALDVTNANRAFAAILVPRTPDRPDRKYGTNKHVRALEYLPFTKASFASIKKKMLIHYRAMTTVLHRGVPVISRIPARFHNIDCQVYILRIQHDALETHQELVVTHVPDSAPPPPPGAARRGRKTYAMLLGATEDDMDEYKRILDFSDVEGVSSPFTIIKIFLERERVRRWDEVDNQIKAFRKKLLHTDRDQKKHTDRDQNKLNAKIRGYDASADPEGLVQLYLDISLLKINLTSWVAQLEGFLKTITDDNPNDQTEDLKYMKAFLSMFVCEYHSKINKCEVILQGASLRFQMETVRLSRMDTNIAIRDGKQMKAVAVLTMIFLPATFIATLLAVPQLKSINDVGPGGSAAWTWYLVLFLPLTVVVLGVYWAWIRFHKPDGIQDLGSGSNV